MSTRVTVDRRAFGDGNPGRVVALHTDTLDLRRITMPSRARAREAAHLLAGITGASSATLALPSATIGARHAPDELRRDGPERYLTLRAALSAWAGRTGTAALDRARTPMGRYLDALRARAAIATAEWRVDGRPATRVVPVAGMAPLRHLGQVGSRALAVNTHYFLLDPRELDAPTAALCEPVGLLAYAGRIASPPILPRAALVRSGGRWRVDHLGLDDLLIDLPGGLTVEAGAPRGARMRYRGDGFRDGARSCAVEACLQGAHVSVLREGGGIRVPHGALVIAFDDELPPNVTAALCEPVGVLAYAGRIASPPILPRAALVRSGGRWRVDHLGLDDLLIDLPGGLTVEAGAPRGARMRYRGDGFRDGARSCAVEACLQGAHVSIVREGGGIRVPHGALVIAFDDELPADVTAALEAGARVRYRLRRHPDLQTALQAGPLLVRGGDVVVDDASFRRERFETLGSDDPTAPLVFPADADRSRAARVGIGVLGDGSLVVVAVEGGSARTPSAAAGGGGVGAKGCTLLELAELLRDHGAVDALNLDGGGSAQLFHGNDAILGSSDTRGDPNGSFDRPVPVAVLARA